MQLGARQKMYSAYTYYKGKDVIPEPVLQNKTLTRSSTGRATEKSTRIDTAVEKKQESKKKSATGRASLKRVVASIGCSRLAHSGYLLSLSRRESINGKVGTSNVIQRGLVPRGRSGKERRNQERRKSTGNDLYGRQTIEKFRSTIDDLRAETVVWRLISSNSMG